MEKILKKAKQEYKDSIRGREYQEELIKNWCYLDEDSIDELTNLRQRKMIFQDRIGLLEALFGKLLED